MLQRAAARNRTRRRMPFNAEAPNAISQQLCKSCFCSTSWQRELSCLPLKLEESSWGGTSQSNTDMADMWAAARTYSLLDAPTMTGAFFGVSMNFSAWAGGLPEYMASAGVSPVACALLSRVRVVEQG